MMVFDIIMVVVVVMWIGGFRIVGGLIGLFVVWMLAFGILGAIMQGLS